MTVGAIDPVSLRRTRRWAASLIGVAGLTNLASALTPPLRDRLALIRSAVPLGVPQAAAALVALAGLCLLLLSRGVRRGQRRAWRLSVTVLVASSVLHVLKGFDVEEAALVASVIWFVRNRSAFRASVDRSSLPQALSTLVVGSAFGVLFGTVAVEITPTRPPRLPLGRAVVAVAERLVGITSIALPSRIGFVTPVLTALGFGVIVAAGWVVLRPVIAPRRSAHDLERARAIFDRHGGDTYAYFALRDDKDHFFWGDSVVAYAVLNGVCLVSPDPIGPLDERAAVWVAFRRFADARSWRVGVLGASDRWLPIYHESHMREIYLGDEGVVDLAGFSLEGGRKKGLRQAVNRVARHGYTVEFFGPGELSPSLRDRLRWIMTQTRRGDAERGFSYTLGRAFDPTDSGVLLAVAFGPGGSAEAFCQFVPAPMVNGYSLDLMRRTRGPHPNGLLDFVVVETIWHLRAQGVSALGLNFAAMRAILAGELGNGLPRRLERWFFHRLSDSIQMESLWRFNAKYDPVWHPRYWVYDAPEHVPAAALAVVRSESVWELPLIGRFLRPPTDAPVST